jgi:hypothetical protein
MNRQKRRAARTTGVKRKRRPPDIKVTITPELIDTARILDWNGAQLMAEAIRRAVPGATDIEVDIGTSRCETAPGERAN